jgi:hypothetical protein
MNKKALLGLALLLAAFAVIGVLEQDGDDPSAEAAEAADRAAAPERAGAPAAQVRFERWQHPQGLFSAEVPAGWRIEGQVDPQGLDKGAFMIQGYSPDGRAMFSFAHNWLWFMEFQYGPYQPGLATVERQVLPRLPANLPQMGLRDIRVVYRSANRGQTLPNPATGMALRGDRGTLGMLAMTGRGEVLAGTLLGETLYMPVPGSPGLWSLRIFSGGLAPANSADQAMIRAIQARLVETLQLAPEFMQAWSQAHQHTVGLMREYSREMDRVFERYLSSTRRSTAAADKDPMEGWAEMMRGGHYEQDDRTGDQHWVGNNHQHWWKNDRGEIHGNNTGQAPANGDNWYGLHR